MPVIRHIAQLGNPVLRQLALPVDNLRDASLQTLIEDMLATVAEADGVGIAAPQVYEPLRLFIVASRPNPRYPDAPSMQPTVMLNPELLWQSPETVMGWEGCLSVPGIRGLVPRSERIRVGYQEHGGGRREEELSGFLARVFQHEFDHISGLVFLDRVASNRDLVSEREYVRLMAAR
ncbi:peptide deformylase [Geobacter sp. SVR]|uniref:peptide deformylase n=1 Tax=Geobacter sp. SVR TaxID=2495594 RepID=UPI00143EFC08|nr:peptide deformylase [Geobacter sp. SVR]BCS55719.1 peptide deformylase 2 [Geobacter sp. SVR]GCF83723.1 peptide deformylase 2 [Geobacter sp. SVR]